ncbi:putative disease resistance protein RGA4 [Cannabis sativa]|uniref:putative disease resistance protein RGA4 n=1 Tax=Cannabis sativa TaxID=3483 RepID=UPI0029CA075C|nr:putative disease resistance protein RGA4 [Cannabis sativa]XP_060967524.1 putative disease resistance protein RGA4 [Cannabis sativa]
MAAELILSPIADKIIGGLGSEAVKHISLIWGVKDELKDLKETISTIQAVLLDAEKKQSHNNQVKNWLQRLSTVVFKADDLMDEFNTQALRRQLIMPQNPMANKVCTFFSSSNQLAFRFKMSRKIEVIQKKLASISNDRNFLLEKGGQETLTASSRVRDTYSYVRHEDVIGRDVDRSVIINKLLLESCEERVPMIAIVGIGGLGKTTLAKSVFNDEKVQKHFELKIWVCVSDDFDLKLIVRKVVESAKGDSNFGDLGMESLLKKFQEILGGKRYFLVLDDIWEENHNKLSELKNLIIRDENAGSRVVVTTRSAHIAKFLTSKQQPYQLGVLDENQSWSLFTRVAFEDGSRERENSSIVKIGKEVVKRCKGIPLAIKTIGNLLHGKSLESEWSSLDKEFSKIPYQHEDDILPTLKLSYDHLASNLKLCFAYCSLFPKDEEIEVINLINLWMAQGFLKLLDESQDQCLEEVGYEWFMTLLEGSFFQDVEVDEFGIITTCKMHDLMHDLAVRVIGEECTTFEISNGQGNIKETTHHVSLVGDTYSGSELSVLLVHAKKFRTFLKLSKFEDEKFFDAIISNCKFIRCLDLKCSSMKLVSNSIGKLKHMRYLDLSDNSHLKSLPNSVTNLVNLQTLKLNSCSNLQELPTDFEKLINLRHLELSFCDKLNSLPSGVGQLENLRYLDLSWSCGLLSLPDSTTDLLNLRTLKLNSCSNLQELPRDFEKLINLRHLELSSCDKLNSLPSGLGQLTQLRYLDLSLNDGLLSLPDSTSDLLNLHTLKLRHCSKLQELPRDLWKLINLRHLDISGCDKLEYMPCGLGQLTNLQKLSNYVLMKSKKSIPRHGGELKELMRLNNLRGGLKVTNLSCEKDVVAEYGTAKLTDKQYVRSLILEWDSDEDEDEAEAIVGYEMSLEGLQPHQNIQELTIRKYGGVKLSSWLSSLTSLVKLRLADCAKCQHLVPLKQLHCLKNLMLERLVCLEYISNTNNMSEDLIGSTTTLLPSLDSLWLFDLPNLKGWWREIVTCGEEEKHMALPYLPCLSALRIIDCPKLTCMPPYPHLNGTLMLSKTSQKPFEETLRVMSSNVNVRSIFPTTSSFSPLSKLEWLILENMDDLECLPDCFKSLTSLNNLNIRSCPKLKNLCPGILHLSSLRHLGIKNCEGLGDMLNSDDYDFMWQALNGRLNLLNLSKLPNIVSVLPKGIQHLTSLQQIEVHSCDSLTTIPECINNLKSLKTLTMDSCPHLTSFPEGIRSLTTLNELKIKDCPMLLRRCKRNTGEDWDKISHIQHLDLLPDPNNTEENENSSNGCNLFNKFGLHNIINKRDQG